MITYIDLAEAAAANGLTNMDLLKQGAAGKLRIFTVPNGKWRLQMTLACKIRETQTESDIYVASDEVTGTPLTMMLLQVSPISLRNFLSYPEDAVVDLLVPDASQTKSNGLTVLIPATDYTLRVKDCHLVIKQEDLLQPAPKAPARTMPRKLTKAQRAERERSTATAIDSTPQPALKQSAQAYLPKSEYMTQAEVADLLRCSKSTVNNRRKTETFPKFHNIGGRTKALKRIELEAWIEAQIIG